MEDDSIAAAAPGQGYGNSDVDTVVAQQQASVVDDFLSRLGALRAAADVWAEEARGVLGAKEASASGGRMDVLGGSLETIQALLAHDVLRAVKVSGAEKGRWVLS